MLFAAPIRIALSKKMALLKSLGRSTAPDVVITVFVPRHCHLILVLPIYSLPAFELSKSKVLTFFSHNFGQELDYTVAYPNQREIYV